MPWWGVTLIAIGAAAVGAAICYIALMVYFARSIRF